METERPAAGCWFFGSNTTSEQFKYNPERLELSSALVEHRGVDQLPTSRLHRPEGLGHGVLLVCKLLPSICLSRFHRTVERQRGFEEDESCEEEL
ncbi:hypothetical protein EYF80_058755 [Liparis tanakae]|uniref:Uncharacterized protein n=1 Tax=Liparis tanakae TaxID=230148 RepID=A0A4Z2ERU6_9TELE|nr:hypothetical protein EYF80_058755 [Liparis tanakae]